MKIIEQTDLWKRTLGNKTSEHHNELIEELRTSYIKFRKNAFYLVSRISAKLPGLTQHEITHLDSLWDTSSLIIGDNYPINPLEGFILGGAILLHDSALCFEAFENGEVGLRNTPQWRDAFVDVKDQNTADFIALRELHAKQAEILLDRCWIDPDNSSELYLLENSTLRKHFGKLIGKIAASHHWDIENLPQKLSIQQNTLPEYPREWRIDPIKLACILRCADAAHIDNLRAPDFLHALIKRNGISLEHWKAQNKLAKVDIDITDPNFETLLFTSTSDFPEKDSKAWYVAYDAICIVDKEIRASNALLYSRDPNLVFNIKRVKGVESPEKLSSYITVNNWKPCSAKIHVNNIENLIKNLGGEMLYGSGSDNLGVVIRELIQNSRDSIKARLFVDNDYSDKLEIKVEHNGNDSWLIIEDNGIGMSERVLTGPLLDFGTTFWSSSLVKSEFPGLRSSEFKSIGKFGIGFYSVFMIADQVVVSSRNWDKGLSDVRQLYFENGLTLRPLLKQGQPNNFPSSVSTQVKLKLKQGIISDNLMIEIKTNKMGSTNFNVSFSNYLSALCSGLDLNVYYTDNENSGVRIHENIKNSNFDKCQWLKDISFSKYQLNNSESYILNNYNRLKPILDNDRIIGLAAISTYISQEQDFLSISTVGGLAQTVHHRDGEIFIGFIDYQPKSAKREIGNYAGTESLIKAWAEEQLNDLSNLSLNPIESYCAASSLCHFKVDSSPIAQILISINKQQLFAKFDVLAEYSTKIGIAFIITGMGNSDHMEIYHDIIDLPGYALVKPILNGSFLSLKLTDNRIPVENYSILDCLWKACINKGFKPSIERLEDVGVNRFNNRLSALILKSEKNN